MADQEHNERRDTTRLEKISLVQVSRFDEEGFRADLATGRTLNISRGGIRLELHHPLPLRSEVRLDLVLQDQIVNVAGTVVYLEVVDEHVCCMGIAFRNLDATAKTLISEVMDESEPES